MVLVLFFFFAIDELVPYVRLIIRVAATPDWYDLALCDMEILRSNNTLSADQADMYQIITRLDNAKLNGKITILICNLRPNHSMEPKLVYWSVFNYNGG
jgi:hypothetical protein